MRNVDREDWKINATPHFHQVRCPIHRNNMEELQNGWFGNPVWWCKECKKPYELKLYEMKKWNQEEVKKQLNEKETNT